MSAHTPKSIESAYTTDNFIQLIEANEYGPVITETQAERIIDLAARRTQTRKETAFDGEPKDFLVTTTWDNFCWETLGGSSLDGGETPNRFALGVPNFDVASGRDAWLIEDAVVVQQGWLETNDGRKSEIKEVDQTDTSYHDEHGEFWAPKDFTALIGLSEELLGLDADAAEAM